MISVLGILITLLFLFPSRVFAITVTISNIPTTISDQPFNIDVSVSGAQAGTNYLRANLFPSGTTKYFGYTFNGSSFVNGSDYSEYLPITIDSSSEWTGTIQAKLDPASSYFAGSGNYSLKVRRYTQSGSSYTWSNEITLAVDFATPTPSPSPTPTPSPTQPPSHSPTSIPTTSSTPKSKTVGTTSNNPTTPKPATPLPSAQNNVTTSIPSNSLVKTEYHIASVAGASSSATPSALVEVKNEKQINFLPWIGGILILAGLGSLTLIYLRGHETIFNKFRGRN